ncbi:MAG: AraC family transcriptional regulator [Alphaproteobacteria bacterium]
MRISRIRTAPPKSGVTRMAVFFRGYSYSPHRHDSYAIGVTTAGVQAFTYRGVACNSQPGQVFVLHPDERHDGRAGDDRGFGYRIAYIDPSLILQSRGGRALPFLREPVSGDRRLYEAVLDVLAEPDDGPDEIETVSNLAALSDALSDLARLPPPPTMTVDWRAVGTVRDFLLNTQDSKISIAQLEAMSALNRWQLARQFRAAYGVSPSRFRVLRRLERARDLLARAHSLADVSFTCGFADQAHFSRQFRRAYGLSPGQWRRLAKGG